MPVQWLDSKIGAKQNLIPPEGSDNENPRREGFAAFIKDTASSAPIHVFEGFQKDAFTMLKYFRIYTLVSFGSRGMTGAVGKFPLFKWHMSSPAGMWREYL